MNACEQASRLSAYHDGEMPFDLRLQFERHLRQCPGCLAELERMRGVTLMLGGMPRPEMPPEVLQRLHQAVDFLPAAGVRRMAAALAAVAAIILVVCMIGLASQASAGGTAGVMPVWESAAVGQPLPEPASGGAEELLAGWMVQDLSWRDRHD
jgi:anti-sigma factor RsiW